MDMKKTSFLITAFIFLLGLMAPQAVFARALNRQDKEKIECAKFKMYVLSSFFDVNQSWEDKAKFVYPRQCGPALENKKIKVPEWLPKELEEMNNLKVVYIPKEGTLSEATLWYRTFANVYAYLDRANNALDPDQPVVMQQLSRNYVGNRIALVSNLDRLNKELVRGTEHYNMKDSMQGRARAMLATLEVINQEFFSTVESFASPVKQREDKYRKSVMAVVTLSNQLWNEFRAAPLPNKMPSADKYKTTEGERLFSTLLLMLGAGLIGAAVYLFLDQKREEALDAWNRYREKSVAWADDFNRQFLTIDVKYIVFGTLAAFGLFGLFMGFSAGGFTGIFLFILFLAFGIVVSVRMPKVVLEHLKKSRGRKINAQLMDSLILLSNSLRSGMDIVQGFELVAHDLQPPISDEFGLVVKNYRLGTPFEKALEGLDERVDSRMLSYTIKAIVIQRQVGGNLTVIFSRLVENIREESKLEEKLDAMTAQQKIQARVVGIMPIIMLGVMFMFRPDEMLSFYCSLLGIIVLFCCAIWVGIGMMLIQKMGEVKV